MSCFGGHMQEYSRVSLDRFDGKNLQSTVYFLSHLHQDHAVGLNGDLLLNRFKSNKDIFLYCSEVTKVLIEKSPKYHKVSPYVKCLDINTPTTITIPDPLYEETEQITVTLLPAFHCPGSVMFLIEGNEGTVLYTGDFRWEHFDIEQMHHLRSADSTKKIKSLYVDTTFCCPENLHIPSRQQCIDAVCQIVQEWTSQSSQHVVYILLRAYYGHEPLINCVASRLNKKAHVGKHKHDVYERIHEFSGNFTYDGTSTQLHACDKKCTVDIDGQTIPCRDAHDEEKVLYILPTTMYFTQFQQLSLEKIVKRIKSNFYRACYSFHSSYTEVKDLLAYLKPDQAFANVKCPKDDTLNQTQHQLNKMLKECKEIGAGEATPVELEVRELGTLKTKPGCNTRKRKGRESPSDSESLDFGCSPKKMLSESSDLESSTLTGNQRGRGRGKGRGKRSQGSVSQTVVSTRRSNRLSASTSMMEDEVTPKKRRTSSRRSVTPDLFVTPEKSKMDEEEMDQQSSYLGSRRSDSELSIISSQKSHDAFLSSSFGETDWTGGSFLAAVSSNEDSQGMVCVTEDNQVLDESSVDEEDVDCDIDESVEGKDVPRDINDPIVATNPEVPENDMKDIPKETERDILKVNDDSDMKEEVLQNVSEVGEESKANIIDNLDNEKEQNTEIERNLDEIVDVNKEMNASDGGIAVNDDLHLHFSGSTVDEDIVDGEIKTTNQNVSDCSPGKESSSDSKHISDDNGVNETTSVSDNEIIILDSEPSEQMTLDEDEEFINGIKTGNETEVAMETSLDDTNHVNVEEKPIADNQEINSIIIKDDSSSDVDSSHDDMVTDKELSKTNDVHRDDSNPANGNVCKDKNDSSADELGDDVKVVGVTGNDVNSEVNMDEKIVDKPLDVDNENCKKTLNEDDDVIEIVDLTGEDLGVQYETQPTSKMGKKSIKISLLSKNVGNKSKKPDENSKTENTKTEAKDNKIIDKTVVTTDRENKQVNKDTVVIETLKHVEGDASEEECEYITSSPEWLSVSEATAKENKTLKNKSNSETAPDTDSEMQTESPETVVVSGEELEKRAEVKRQAMGFVCETDSESNSDSDSAPDSPTAEVLYDDYIELSSDSDDDNGDDDDPSGSGSKTGGSKGADKKSNRSSDNRRSNSSPDWLSSHKRKGHSDGDGESESESDSERSEQKESSEKNESDSNNMSSNEMIGKNIESVSVSAFKKREYRRSMNNYRSNQTPLTTNSLQSSYNVSSPVHSYQRTSYPSHFLGGQFFPPNYPPANNYINNYPEKTGLHPSVPCVSEAASISLPSMIPRTSEPESHDSESSHTRTVTLSVQPKQHPPAKDKNKLSPWQEERAKLFQRGPTALYKGHVNSIKSKQSSWTSNAQMSRDYQRAEGQLETNQGQGPATVTDQLVMKAPEKVDIASIKANISALTGITVVNAQSAPSIGIGKETGESLDEMVEKLKKIEQMKALLNVVSGTTPETNSVSNAETGAGEVFDYAHRNTREFDEVEEEYQRRRNYEETFRDHPGGEYRREPYIHDREFARRISREDEDYEHWLRERRHDGYLRRPPSPSWRYPEDAYHDHPPHYRSSDFVRPVPFPHRDSVYDESARYREHEYDRPPLWHRDHDPDYGRHSPMYHRELEYERPPHYLDQEYERSLPPPWRPEYERAPPWHRDTEYERPPPWHRDPDYERPPLWHRDTEYERPPPWHRDPDYERPPPPLRDFEYERPPPPLRDFEYERPPPPSHIHHPPRIHPQDEYPYTNIKESDHGHGIGNQNSYNSDDQYPASGGGGPAKTASILKLNAQLKDFKKKPIMTRVLSRSGQVLSVGQANTSLQHMQTIKSVDDVKVNTSSNTDADTPVFQTGIIPANR